MSETHEVVATEIKANEEIFFPNSRHAQVVQAIVHDTDKGTITFHAEDAQWVVPEGWMVKRTVQVEEEITDGDQ